MPYLFIEFPDEEATVEFNNACTVKMTVHDGQLQIEITGHDDRATILLDQTIDLPEPDIDEDDQGDRPIIDPEYISAKVKEIDDAFTKSPHYQGGDICVETDKDGEFSVIEFRGDEDHAFDVTQTPGGYDFKPRDD